MPEYEINGKIIEYVSGFFEAKSQEEAMNMAFEAFKKGECMFADKLIETEVVKKFPLVGKRHPPVE
jgi:hypothetical protein